MRDEGVTGQRAENAGWGGGMGSCSQVLSAHLQIATSGVQVYLGDPEENYQGPFHTKKGVFLLPGRQYG